MTQKIHFALLPSIPFGTVIALGMFILVLGVGTSQAQPTQPSFDCAKARLGVEKEICNSDELSKLDAEIATAYAAASKMLDMGRDSALLETQKEFIAVRNLGETAWNFVLKDHLQRRLDLLQKVRSSGGKWIGNWGNENGVMTLSPGPNGLLNLKIKSDDKAGGLWTCEFDYGAKISGNKVTTVARSKEEEADNPYDGWSLVLMRRGDSISIKEIRAQDEVIENPFCGVHGSLEGIYLPVED